MSVTAVCRKLNMTRQNYYARRRQRERQQIDEELVVQLALRERQSQPRLGTRKLHFLLQGPLAEAGVKIGRDRLFEILGERELLLEPKPAEYPCTTDSSHCLPVFTNRLKDLEVTKPNQAWVVDLTYVRTAEGFIYLALLTDKMSRKIVGSHCGDTLETEGCLQALEQALRDLPAGVYPLHHSDKGTQYCSRAYVNRLQERGLSISMTEINHCAENALAERVNGILKAEYGLGGRFGSKAEARRAIAQGINLYNTRRPHTALGYRVPAVVHSLAA